jgi:hypothetical protein
VLKTDKKLEFEVDVDVEGPADMMERGGEERVLVDDGVDDTKGGIDK